MPRTLSDSFFGSIALKNKMLTRDQLTQALRVQWERAAEWGDDVAPALGEVCRTLGFLSEDQVNAIVWAQAKSEVMLEDSLAGRICLRNRLLTQAQLDQALADQRGLDFTVRLGDILCRRGYIDRQQLRAVLKAQTRLKSGRLQPVIVPPERPAAAAAAVATLAKPPGKPAKSKPPKAKKKSARRR